MKYLRLKLNFEEKYHTDELILILKISRKIVLITVEAKSA